MPRLSLSAANSVDLLAQLAATDITVPLRTEGRTTEHCEQYTTARVLATIAESSVIEYPLRLEHRDKPDFRLHLPGKSVGIECTEAVSDEWAHIDAIRERDFPESMVMLPMLKPGERKFTPVERVAIASGRKSGPPWVGKMAARQWAEAIAHFVERKTAKLRSGSYDATAENWLLIQDEWRVPVYRLEDRREAAKLCIEKIASLLESPAFTRIYVTNSNWLLRLAPGAIEIQPINNLWN